MATRPSLSVGGIWNGMLLALRGQWQMLFAVAAPFTLLVSMAVSLFGPQPPTKMADYTPSVVFWLFMLPSLIGAVAQLAVARLVANPGESPGHALRIGLAAMPAYLLASLIIAVPVALGFLALVIPGLYLMARFFITAPVAALEGAAPMDIVKRSWALTEGQGGTILVFLGLGLLFVLGLSLLSAGVGAAVASMFSVMGMDAVANFLDKLVPSLVGTFVSIGSAAAATVIHAQLTAPGAQLDDIFS
jgi:hypothetical protein